MSLAAQTPRRVWRTPTSWARWLWLVLCGALYAIILILYIFALRTQLFPGPFNEPLRSFGIVALVMVLGTATYSLRRRFARGLPGRAQDWLWMHTWLGITAILVALLHENFTHILHDYCQNLSCLTQAHAGTSALLALILLVLSGIIGRLLDLWQARTISRDAVANDVGIARALEERILELEYTVERLSAGKSEPFKRYCLQAINAGAGYTQTQAPTLDPREQADFQHACESLASRSRLVSSLERQNRARSIMRLWRTIHIVLACLALLIILYHGLLELLTSILHIVPQ